MASIPEMVKSRQASIDKLEKDVADYEARIAKIGPTTPAGYALASVIKVHKARLNKLRAELAGFMQILEADARQTAIPGTERKR